LDIEEVALTVMMNATNSADSDLKQIMDEVKSMNAAKEGLRSLEPALKAEGTAGVQMGATEVGGAQPAASNPDGVAQVLQGLTERPDTIRQK